MHLSTRDQWDRVDLWSARFNDNQLFKVEEAQKTSFTEKEVSLSLKDDWNTISLEQIIPEMMQKSQFSSSSQDCGFLTCHEMVVFYCKSEGMISISDLESLQESISRKNSLGTRRLDEDGPGAFEYFIDLETKIISISLEHETLTVLTEKGVKVWFYEDFRNIEDLSSEVLFL